MQRVRFMRQPQVQPDIIISTETHNVARTIDPVRMIAHVVIGIIGFALFGDRRANVRSSIPAISPNTATNIRKIKICCISFSSSRDLSRFLKISFKSRSRSVYLSGVLTPATETELLPTACRGGGASHTEI